MAVLVQVPARAGPTQRGVIVQQDAGLPVRQLAEPGIRAHVTRADDLARPRAAIGDKHGPAGYGPSTAAAGAGGAGVPVQGLLHVVLTDLAATAKLAPGALRLHPQRRPAKSRSSMLTTRISSARPEVSWSIRHSVFSRKCTSQRAISRSIAIFERTGVSESGTASRFARAGTDGPSYPRSRHQPSQDSTAARQEFLVC